jgi:N-acetylglucosamine kinase-like BadF-type ATPase
MDICEEVPKIITPQSQKRFEMILIADSGSTKTEWVLLHHNQVICKAHTQGINPYFQNSAQIEDILSLELLPALLPHQPQQVTQVFYYGAGCSAPEPVATVAKPLHNFFGSASIEVEHDLLAAARAACGNQPGIAAILGTGSNSCLFDGTHITANQPSLGFMLGDEGSGGYIGKQLLRLFLYRELTPELYEAFATEYELTKEVVLENIYKKPMPNRYAASFTRFVGKHIDHPQMHALVIQSFTDFFRHHITSYPNYQAYALSAVGSVAVVFETQLREVCDSYGIQLKHVIKQPIDGLISFHTAIQ